MKSSVIIIGSGFGGLVCAHLLAQEGYRPLVLESHWQPGGSLQSYRRKDNVFDTGFHYVGGLDKGQALHDVFSRLGLLRLPWCRMDHNGFDRITIGGHTYSFAEGFDRFAEVLAADFPHERQALRRYVCMLQESDPEPAVNAWKWLNDNFQDPLLIDVLSGSCLKTELRRESLPLFAFAHSQKSYIQSSWRLRGDSGLIVRSLVNDIHNMGGEVVCRAAVQKLVTKDRHVIAAVCGNGKTYKADRFISDIHPAQMFSLIDNDGIRNSIFSRRILMLENTRGLYTHSLVLKPHALPYFNHNKYIYRGGSPWDETTESIMLSCRVPKNIVEYATLLDIITPQATNPIPLAETAIPGLRNMISEHYVSTPHTWQHFTRTPGGSAYGIRKDCRKPLFTILSPSTPVPNLFLTGQSIMLHGLEGVAMTAMQTVDTILKQDN